MERVSYRLNSSLISTNKDEMSPSSIDIEFVGLNAENGNEMGTRYPYLCKNSNYFDNQTGTHQEIIHELDWYGYDWHKEIAETILKSVPTKITGQDGKIRELRRSCNNLWMHYELNCTYTIIEKCEDNSEYNTKCCESRVKTQNIQLHMYVACHYETSCGILGKKQAKAEPGQAQPQRRPESN